MSDPNGKGFTNDAIPALSVVESPIEGRLIQAFVDLKNAPPVYYHRDDCKLAMRFNFPGRGTFEALIQYAPDYLNGKRFDFMFTEISMGIEAKLAVEVDGANFHSSKEARLNDITKDRESIKRGVPVIRFSGSEVFYSARNVAMEICEVLFETHLRAEGLIGRGMVCAANGKINTHCLSDALGLILTGALIEGDAA